MLSDCLFGIFFIWQEFFKLGMPRDSNLIDVPEDHPDGQDKPERESVTPHRHFLSAWARRALP